MARKRVFLGVCSRIAETLLAIQQREDHYGPEYDLALHNCTVIIRVMFALMALCYFPIVLIFYFILNFVLERQPSPQKNYRDKDLI